MRPQIGLELFDLTLYIVILSILIDEENKNIFLIIIMSINWKYKFSPKDRGVPHQKSVEVAKLKILHK